MIVYNIVKKVVLVLEEGYEDGAGFQPSYRIEPGFQRFGRDFGMFVLESCVGVVYSTASSMVVGMFPIDTKLDVLLDAIDAHKDCLARV